MPSNRNNIFKVLPVLQNNQCIHYPLALSKLTK